MDITPIYDLRARLRAAMIAGTNLLSEDFRLKRAVEAIVPLEQASPVFARIGQLSRALLDPAREDKEGALLDTITLVDAVLCTQGAVAVSTGGRQGAEKEIEKLPGNTWGSAVTNAPYSVVSALKQALTSSGSGHFSFVTETHEAHPELFFDYRVKAAMVQALGAAYSELAEKMEEWLKKDDVSLLPLLQNQFDPCGKKEMVRRVRVMEAIAPREANDFFIEQLSDAKKEVRQALIYSLRHCPENEDLLWELVKSEKGNAKQMAEHALANMESDRVRQHFTDMFENNPRYAIQFIMYMQNTWSSQLVAAKLEELLKPFEDRKDYFLTQEQASVLQYTLQAMAGKTGPEVIRALQKTIQLESKLLHPFEDKKKVWTIPLRYSGSYRPNHEGATTFRDMLIQTIHRTLIRCADPEVGRLAMEVYEKKQRNREGGEAYFSTAAVAHLLTDEDCSGWLSKQLLGLIRPTKLYTSLYWAWNGISWSEARGEFTFKNIDINYDVLDGYRTQYVYSVKQDFTGRIADIFMKCKDINLDNLLVKFVRPGDENYRMKLENYCYKCALEVGDNRHYMLMLKKLGCRRCEGLAVQYFKRYTGKLSLWEFKHFESYYLPGETKAKYEELMKVYDLIKRGKVQLQKGPGSAEEDFLAYLEELKC